MNPELERLQDAFLKADALAQKGDAQAAEDARAFAAEIKRLSTQAPRDVGRNGFMGQVNAGIADLGGGLVDLINPFDDPVWAQYGMQTGSAREGMAQGMNAIGEAIGGQPIVADSPPETVWQGMGRGFGQAIAAVVPVAKAADFVAKAPGVAGAVAGQISGALKNYAGVAGEAVAGAMSGGATEVARQAGAPEWVQNTAGVLAPMSVPLAGSVARLGGQAVMAAPVVGTAARTVGNFARGMLPMTKEGAFGVASERVRSLAGGDDRAAQVAAEIKPNDPLKRTPAGQTGDENLIGLERAAAAESPVLRERLKAREAESREAARLELQRGASQIRDAKEYFKARLKSFKADLKARVDTAVKMGTEALEATGPRTSESGASGGVVTQIKGELDLALQREAELWKAVPTDAMVSTKGTAGTIDAFLKDTPWAQQADVPAIAKAAFGKNGALGEVTTVAELHGLYSEMRRIARSAMAGTNQNKNMARIANGIAEAILGDLGAIGGGTPAGRAINEARTFSRALHETFDQGTVGKILNRTVDGDETIPAETALAKTVGRGGTQGLADVRGIEAAAPGAKEGIAEYLRGRFTDAVFTAEGEFSPRRASEWMRLNRETLSRYPELQAEFAKAMKTRSAADAMALRAAARVKLAENQSPVAGFVRGPDQKAVLSVLGADEPATAARSIMAAARKDPSGKAVAGVKAAFSDYLISSAMTAEGLSGTGLVSALRDPSLLGALRQVYDGKELARIQSIAAGLARADAAGANVGPVINAPANVLLDYVARIGAARVGGNMGAGSMGGSLQTANIMVGRAKDLLANLTNSRARQLILDAVEDPELFRALLMSPGAVAKSPDVKARLAPYLTGAVAATATEDR